MNNISMREWIWFGLSQFIVIVLFFIGYNPFEFFRAFHMAMANNTTEGQSHFWLYRMIVWLYSVFDLVKIIIASFLAAVFVVRIYEQKLKPGVLGKYRESIYASMTGSIFLYLAFMPVVKIYKTAVVGFLELLPYASKFHILPFVFDIVFKVFLLAIFTWIAAAAISIPIKTQYDLEWEEKDATTESEFAE